MISCNFTNNNESATILTGMRERPLQKYPDE